MQLYPFSAEPLIKSLEPENAVPPDVSQLPIMVAAGDDATTGEFCDDAFGTMNCRQACLLKA
jgi:hypothetical protein